MNKFILNYLGVFFILLSALSFFNIIYSYYFNLYLNIDAYFYTFLISIIIGASSFIRNKIEIKITIYSKIIAVIIGYFLLPLIISIPYYFSIYNLSFLNCFFESVSGFTSTGFTVFENIKQLDQSLIIWRSTSQWIGGIYFLFSILLLIDIFDDSLKKSLTNFISFNYSETFKQSFKIFILYTALTLFLFATLKLINLRTFDSFNIAMTIISSGGFLPVNDIGGIVNSNFKEIIFSFLMLFSYFSLFLIYNILFLKKKSLNFFAEDIYLLIYFLILLIVFFIFFNFDYNFSTILFSLTSSMSNIGISFKNSPSNLWFIFIIIVIIGGSFFSTSSGIRFLKIYFLFKYSLNEILSYSRPNNVYTNKFHLIDSNIGQKDINKYFLSVMIFIISLFSITSLLSIFGINFEESFKLGILTLMNTVNSSMYDLNNFDFLELNSYSKLIIIIFMIIGRVELLTILIIAKKFIFKS
jgi:trk system potassium uptake protein TrkH